MSDRVSPLSVSTTPRGFDLSGEIDAGTAETLASLLRSAAGNAGDTELGMSDIYFIDSSGLRVLIEAHQEAEKRGHRIVIAEPSPVVTRLLGISGLTNYLHLRLSAG